MPLHWTIDSREQLVTAVADGGVRRDEMDAYLDAIAGAGAGNYRKLFDGRLSVAKYNDHDLMMLGARMSAYASNLEPRGAAAFIVPDEAASDLAKRFINLAKVKHPVGIFLSEDKARKWLAEQPET